MGRGEDSSARKKVRTVPEEVSLMTVSRKEAVIGPTIAFSGGPGGRCTLQRRRIRLLTH